MTKTLRFLSLLTLSFFILGGGLPAAQDAFAQSAKTAAEKPADVKPDAAALKAKEESPAAGEETEAAGGANAAAAPVEIGINAELAYILNTFLLLIGGMLVMWMAAGFTMLEAGLVRTRNTSAVCLKNLMVFAVAGPLYYLIGYNIMYGTPASHGLWGSFTFFARPAADEVALLLTDGGTLGELTTSVVSAVPHSGMSDWFFQMALVAAAAFIVAGAMAERVRLWPFLMFTGVLCAVIYPIQGSWSWGGGWLTGVGEEGFKDFAGATLVHSAGGWAALTGALILGPRAGKYAADGSLRPLPGANLPLAALGTFILWFGWFGFNGASMLAMDSAKAVTAIAIVMANTNLAACGGACAAMIYAALRFGKPDLTVVLNGALAGLVAITAGPDIANPLVAFIIGVIGGILCSAAIPLFDKLRIDDVVGALSVHLVPGIWGTFAVALFTTGDYEAQLTGIIATGAFVGTASAAVWLFLKHTIGIRLDEQDERLGADIAELGLEAYPEFEKRSV